MGWVQIFPLVVGWVGLGQSADGLGWVTRNGPMDNCGRAVTSLPRIFQSALTTHDVPARLAVQPTPTSYCGFLSKPVNCEDPEYPLLTILVGEVRDKDAAIEQLCDAKMKSMTQLLQLLASVSWTLVSPCLSMADCRCNIRRNSRSNTRNRGSVAEWLAWWT